MTIIALKCPNCSGDVQLDDGREFGFCIYCGTRIMISDFVTRKIEIDYSGKASSYADIALDWLNRGEMERAREYADKALDLDPSNPDAWYVRGMLSEERVDKTMAFERSVRSRRSDIVESSKLELDELYRGFDVVIVNEFYPSALPGQVLVDGKPVLSMKEPEKRIRVPPGLHEFVIKLDGYKKVSARLEHDIQDDSTVLLTRKYGITGITTVIKVVKGSESNQRCICIDH